MLLILISTALVAIELIQYVLAGSSNFTAHFAHIAPNLHQHGRRLRMLIRNWRQRPTFMWGRLTVLRREVSICIRFFSDFGVVADMALSRFVLSAEDRILSSNEIVRLIFFDHPVAPPNASLQVSRRS